MSGDWNQLEELIGNVGALVRVSVIDVNGSTPRDAGAWMLVWRDATQNTIGGGQLEFAAIGKARKLLEIHGEIGPAWHRATQVYPLGPGLGQCCGGAVRLLFEVLTSRECACPPIAELSEAKPAHYPLVIRPTISGRPLLMASDRRADYGLPKQVTRVVKEMLSGTCPRAATLIKLRGTDPWYIEPCAARTTPLYIYGAGHVGRAIIDHVSRLEFDIRWVDTARERFPQSIPSQVIPAITPAPEDVARGSVANAFHLVLTFSHALDLAICHALLARDDFAFLGLIGSQTKRARFLKRLRDGGITEAALGRLVCPIGISNIRGKEPATIAISVAAQLIERQELSRQEAGKHQRGAGHV